MDHSRTPSLIRGIVRGAGAGAAGTTALNAATYIDMVWRARPSSQTPRQTVEKLVDITPLEVPGEGENRDHRIAGLGPLMGIIAGVGPGAALGLVRATGWRPRPAVTILLATVGALLVGNAPMTMLGVSDPRRWTMADWLSDVIPHIAYGVVSGLVLCEAT